MANFWVILGLLVFISQPILAMWTMPTTQTGASTVKNLVYSRGTLLDLRPLAVLPSMDSTLFKNVLKCLLVGISWKKLNIKVKRRKRGSRGGILKRLRRRGSRLPLPAIILLNVRSLRNKTDELSALIKYDGDYRHTSLFCFTETWLSQETADFYLDGFTLIWFDRDTFKTQKTVGGGLCMAVNNRWATNFTLRETDCSKHYEIMVVSFRPHYLPREFTQITVILVYVPGPDFILAAECIADIFNNIVNRVGDQPVFLLGDFNRCDIAIHLPYLEQYVTCVTRLEKTLDLCYGNIPSAYISKARPPLGRSDHNAVLLLPRYKQKFKTEKVQTRTVQVWDFESTEKLRGCFEVTDWDVFVKDCGNDVDMLNASISGYVDFCVDSVIPVKNVRCYPNNKPWVTKDLKHFLNLKKNSFFKWR